MLDTCLRVETEPRHATYVLLSGDSLTIRHHGEPVTLHGDKPRRLDIRAPQPPGPAPDRPPHRRPGRHRGRPGRVSRRTWTPACGSPSRTRWSCWTCWRTRSHCACRSSR
nr:glycosyl hydrolase family 65 protein [Streptomyces akebiae]